MDSRRPMAMHTCKHTRNCFKYGSVGTKARFPRELISPLNDCEASSNEERLLVHFVRKILLTRRCFLTLLLTSQADAPNINAEMSSLPSDKVLVWDAIFNPYKFVTSEILRTQYNLYQSQIPTRMLLLQPRTSYIFGICTSMVKCGSCESPLTGTRNSTLNFQLVPRNLCFPYVPRKILLSHKTPAHQNKINPFS
jgi:hypothetical protein